MLAAADRRPHRLHVEPLEDRYTPATLSVADITVTEGTDGTQTAAVRVTLSEPLKKSVTVLYGTANGSAIAGSDYAAVNGQLTFSKGQTVKTVLVPVYGDQQPESDESFYVRIFSATKGVNVADGQGTVTIADPTPRLSITGADGVEGGVMTFTVSLSAPLATAFTVNFATLDSLAIAGEDYAATSGTLTFAPGETTKTFTVQILADNVEEYDEEFYIELSNPSAPVLITSIGLGIIYGELGPDPTWG